MIAPVLAAAISGCGSGQVAPITATSSPPASTQPAAARTPAVNTPNHPIPNSAAPPAFVLKSKNEDGDRVSVEGRFGQALPLAQSDANQSAVGQCPQSDGRELVAHLELTTTIRSSLAADVVLDDFLTDGQASRQTEFLMGYTNGPTCESEAGINHKVDLGTLQPRIPHRFSIWIILDDAVTPNDPHPSASKLGRDWRLPIPTVLIDSKPTASDTTVGGLRVVSCTNEGIEGDLFVSIAGTVPHSIHGITKERIPCMRLPTP